MIVNKIENFKGGWVVGNFLPSIYMSGDVEVGVKFFDVGDKEPSHKQLIATEITVIHEGKVRIANEFLSSGDILVIEPGQYADFEALTKGSLTCIKFPSIPSDKVLE
jgi:hypothetical protein